MVRRERMAAAARDERIGLGERRSIGVGRPEVFSIGGARVSGFWLVGVGLRISGVVMGGRWC